MLAGIIAIREMHTRVVKETGFTCAEEMLYPENHRYLSDLLAYVAVGARSVEDQLHRIVGSGVGIPVGMKNPTSGDISVMMNSITAAQAHQKFLYRGWEVTTDGNPLAHAILRGYVDAYGRAHANYHYEDLRALIDAYAESKLQNPAVIGITTRNFWRVVNRKFLDEGWYLAFGGGTTYTKKSKMEEMLALLRYVPDDRILMETDAPYLAPVPFRGQTNTPVLIEYCYDFVANARKTSPQQLSELVDKNIKILFNL